VTDTTDARRYDARVKLAVLATLLLFALAPVACSGGSSAASPTSSAGLQTTRLTADGGHVVDVEIAATAAEREHGLSDRDALPQDAGMLFDMEQVSTPDFWMKDMRFPLDLVWIDARKRIAGITFDVQPQPGAPDAALRLYRAPSPIRYVLEVNAGAAQRLGLVSGSTVKFDLPARPATATPAK
jgi:uncharacterized membrane protein (UPF0127 family)